MEDSMKKKSKEDPSMWRARRAFEKSGLSLNELGSRMGYPAEHARQSAWQFLRHTSDPRISMLRRFCQATGLDLRDLL